MGRRNAQGVKLVQGSVQILQGRFWWLHISSHCNLGILYKAVIFKSGCKLTAFTLISLNKDHGWRRHVHWFVSSRPKTLKTLLFKLLTSILGTSTRTLLSCNNGCKTHSINVHWGAWGSMPATETPKSCSSTKWPSKRRYFMNELFGPIPNTGWWINMSFSWQNHYFATCLYFFKVWKRLLWIFGKLKSHNNYL